jgi:ATP-binding cassette subfamily B protein
MRANIIHVMDSGRIVESGSHHQLLAKGGLYAQSWIAQMRAAGEGSEYSGIEAEAVLEGVRL